MAPAEFVRNAAVNLSIGKLAPIAEPFPSEIAGQIERMFRGVYLLATLRRNEMIRDGRKAELEEIAKAATEALASIRDKTAI